MSHLIAFGMDRDKERVAVLISDTAAIPISILDASLRLSRQLHTGNFPPTSGQIIETAVRLCQQAEPDRYQNPLGGIRKPNWYQYMKRIQFDRPPAIAAG